MNVIARLEFQVTHYDVAVQCVNSYAMKTPSLIVCLVLWHVNACFIMLLFYFFSQAICDDLHLPYTKGHVALHVGCVKQSFAI